MGIHWFVFFKNILLKCIKYMSKQLTSLSSPHFQHSDVIHGSSKSLFDISSSQLILFSAWENVSFIHTHTHLKYNRMLEWSITVTNWAQTQYSVVVKNMP